MRQLHNVTQKFETVSALCSALWHELENEVPEEGDFNAGYFEGKHQTKKWLVLTQDLDAMYSYFGGKESISLWCDGKEPDESGEEKRDAQAQNKRSETDDELEDIFQQLKQKHESKYSGPQLLIEDSILSLLLKNA